jgi:uncharacterized membrane protein YkgB
MDCKKLINYAGWLTGGIGALLMLIGTISFLFDTKIFSVRYFYNWFYIGNSFIFLAIFCLLGGLSCKDGCCREEPGEGK